MSPAPNGPGNGAPEGLIRWKRLKSNGKGRIWEGKKRDPHAYFVQGPRVPGYAIGLMIGGSSFYRPDANTQHQSTEGLISKYCFKHN